MNHVLVILAGESRYPSNAMITSVAYDKNHKTFSVLTGKQAVIRLQWGKSYYKGYARRIIRKTVSAICHDMKPRCPSAAFSYCLETVWR